MFFDNYFCIKLNAARITRGPPVRKEVYFTFSDHTFGIPIPCYPEDKLDESLTSERCSGSGKHDYKHPMQLCTLHLLQKPGLLDIRYINPLYDFYRWRSYQPQYPKPKEQRHSTS